MDENKFEKQVKQKMDELQIQPPDAVWKKIEMRIAKKKSRRWGLLILFLCIGFILPGSYWLWKIQHQRFSEQNNSVKANAEKDISQNLAKRDKTFQSKFNDIPDPIIQKNNKDVSEENKNENKDSIEHYKLFTPSKANQKINSARETPVAFFKEKKAIAAISDKTGSEIISEQSSEEASENKQQDKRFKDSIDQKTGINSLSKQVVSNPVTKVNDTSKQKEADTVTVKQSMKNKWKFGIVFSGGLSGVGNDFLALSNPTTFSSPGSFNSGTPSGFSSVVTKAGFGLITGVFGEKNISKKLTFTLGINFKSFNTSFKLSDSGGIYTARSAADKYINHFNFIEFPVSLKIQLGKGKNIPFFWQAGFVVSELVNSNALQFNSSAGYYYKDNSVFNKTQIGFNTSLSVLLFSKQKESILIGPCLYYDASEIAKENLYNKKRFVFTGLKAEIIFGK